MIASEGRTLVGRVGEIRRYPVKSMQGESLERVEMSPKGLQGDRRFAVIDTETGRIASAKNPRKWAGLLQLKAELRDGVLWMTSENGVLLRSDRDDLASELSELLGRTVTVCGTPTAVATIEVHWPEVSGLSQAGSETVEELPSESYCDVAPVHLLTTASLRQFGSLAPDADFDARRFRPNILIETIPELTGFVEAGWTGRALVIGDTLLHVTAPCTRCVMTTLAQPGLAPDPRILRSAVIHNSAASGVYAVPARPRGEIGVGDSVWLA